MPPSSNARVSLGDVAGSILDAKLPTGGLAVPILARRKGPERKIAEAKAEERAQHEVARAKRSLSEQPHKALKGVQQVTTTDLVLETHLRKIATKGVVVLFNAVRTAQKDKDDSSSGSKAKRRREATESAAASASQSGADLSKDSFLDILRRGAGPYKAERAANKPAERGSVDHGGSTARFLRDDFMLGRQKSKDWGTDLEADEENYVEDSRGADVDSD